MDRQTDGRSGWRIRAHYRRAPSAYIPSHSRASSCNVAAVLVFVVVFVLFVLVVGDAIDAGRTVLVGVVHGRQERLRRIPVRLPAPVS